VYVEPHEWLAVGNWVYEHWDEVSGLAFLPKSNANYPLAPYEEIDQVTYQKLLAVFPKINWAKLRRYETEDMTTSAQELACVGGVCEL
jgi:ribonucleoside-diphosphate reductase alpha chain